MATGVRDYLIEEYTRSVCPQCMERPLRSDDPDVWKDAMLVSHDGSVWMRRFCHRHGESESLYEEHLDLWRARRGWSTPTSRVVPDRETNHGGSLHSYAEGLPSSHGQHTCILLLNVTEHCNFSCPTCYASALDPGSPLQAPEHPSLNELLSTVDTMLARENGRLGVVMLSGGEPTLRRDLPTILRELAARPVTRILLNTNGRRIARDSSMAQLLSELKDRVEVYLQFDGLTGSTYQALRGDDVLAEKLRTVELLSQACIPTTLVMTAKHGVNDQEIGPVTDLAMSTPWVTGLAIQPVFGSGRGTGIDPVSRLTPTGAIRRLELQTSGRLKSADFVPLPCSHADCCDIAYFLKDKRGSWTSVPDLVGRDELKNWIHVAANTISFEDTSEAVKALVRDGVLQRVFSEQQKTSSLKLAGDLFRLCGCVPGVSELLGLAAEKKATNALADLAQRTFRLTVKMFMDSHTFHEARLRQCCVHTGTFESDPRRLSFCWRWMFADATDFPERERLTPLQLAQ